MIRVEPWYKGFRRHPIAWIAVLRRSDLLVHGTTVATNVVVQRAGARVALITTAGFRDLLHIQRQSRPRLYDMHTFRAAPLVRRALRVRG